ncbi:MAG: GNAT family N-acetyltransferase [Steroidobacteraceae bacterium]
MAQTPGVEQHVSVTSLLTPLDPARIDPLAWEQLARGRPHLRLDLLQSWSALQPGGLLILARTNGDAIEAAAVGILVDAAGGEGIEQPLFGRSQGAFARLRVLGDYLCVGAPIGQDSGLLPGSGADDAHVRMVDLLSALERWSAHARLGLAFIALPTANEAATQFLRRRGYLSTGTRSGTEMHVDWTDFDSYCRSLDARKPGAGATPRYERRRCARSGVTISMVPSSSKNGDALQALTEAHNQHKNGRGLGLVPGFLATTVQRLGDAAVLLESRRDGRRTAMLSYIRSGDVAWACFYGVEKCADRPNDFTYFNLVFYAFADHVARLGIARIQLGNSAYGAKLKRGAVRVPMGLWFRPRSLARRLLLRPVFAAHRHLAAPKLA